MGSSGPGRVRVERGIYRQPNGKFAVCWRHAGRLRFRTVGFDLAEARRERLALIAATREGSEPVSPRLRFETVAGWWVDRFAAKVAAGERHPRTLEAHRYQLDRHLLPALGRRRIAAITVDDVAELLHELRLTGRSAKTAVSALATLQSVMRFARRCGWIVVDPVERLEHDERPRPGRRRQRVLGRAEIERLLAACSPRDRLMIATVLYTGLRISEMLGLVWDDVDFAAGVIHVRAQLSRAHRGAPARRVAPKTPPRSATSRSSPSSPACLAPTGSAAGSREARTGCSRPPAAPPTAIATSAGASWRAPPSLPGSTTTGGRRFASTTCATPSPAT
jgi:integrase